MRLCRTDAASGEGVERHSRESARAFRSINRVSTQAYDTSAIAISSE
jgi:hypothetical protein